MTRLEKSLARFMLITGTLTLIAGVGLFAPAQIQQSMFEAVSLDPVALLLTRGWGGLVAVSGLLLILGARSPVHRDFSLNIAAGCKAMFISLVLVWGREFIPSLAGALLLDALVVIVALINQVTSKSASRS